MAFHYRRDPGAEAAVHREEGDPRGTPARQLFAGGAPQVRVALELSAAFAAIAVIAEEDGVVHGDLDLDAVWITGDGAVSLGDYLVEGRRQSRAPEGVPRGTATDRYGLGRLLARTLLANAARLDEAPNTGAVAHDDAMAAMVMDAEIPGLAERTVNDLRWYILHLLSFDRAERPEPLAVWQSLEAFARTAAGPSLAAWATAAHRGAADVRAPVVVEVPDDTLAAPRARGAGLLSGVRFSEEPSTTLFWKRDAAPRAAPGGDAVEPVPSPGLGGSTSARGRGAVEPDPVVNASTARTAPARPGSRSRAVAEVPLERPEPGGGERTGHWSIGELRAMAREVAEGPRPRRDAPVFSDRARSAASASSASTAPAPAPAARAAAPPREGVASATSTPPRRSLRDRVGARVAETEAAAAPAPVAEPAQPPASAAPSQGRRALAARRGAAEPSAPTPPARRGRREAPAVDEEEPDALPRSVVALLAVAVLAAAAMVGVLVVSLLGGGLTPPPVAVSPLEAE